MFAKVRDQGLGCTSAAVVALCALACGSESSGGGAGGAGAVGGAGAAGGASGAQGGGGGAAAGARGGVSGSGGNVGGSAGSGGSTRVAGRGGAAGGSGAGGTSGGSAGTGGTGGGCAAGTADCNGDPGDGCECEVLASDVRVEPNVMVQDSTDLYWLLDTVLQTDSLVTLPKAGGAVSVLLGSAAFDRPGGLALSGTTLYWTDAGLEVVGTVSTDGTGQSTFATGLSSPMGVRVDDTNVYWAERDGIQAAPIAGGAASPLVSGQPAPSPFVVGDTHVYWANNGFGADTVVRRVPLAGGSPEEVVTAAAEVYGLDLDASSVYFAAGQDIYSAPLAGGAAELLASSTDFTGTIHVDGSDVYFMGPGIHRVPVSGGSPVDITPVVSGGDFAVDADYVYFLVGREFYRAPR